MAANSKVGIFWDYGEHDLWSIFPIFNVHCGQLYRELPATEFLHESRAKLSSCELYQSHRKTFGHH